MSGERKRIDLGSKYLVCEARDRVMTVRIDRVAKRNAMTQDMYRGVKRAAILADEDPELDLLLASDVSIASDRASFRAPELLRGAPDPMLSGRLPAYVGLGRAKYLYFTAAVFDAEQALAMGLVGKVVPHECFGEEVEATLRAIAKTGPKARELVKRDMSRFLPTVDIDLFRRTILSPEMVEGMTAFLEKRDPVWPRD